METRTRPKARRADQLARSRLTYRARDCVFELGRNTLIMGVINVTPDSFSDGGLYSRADAAIKQGTSLAGQGALILDVGGESTRPGSDPVTAAEELQRVIPVIEGLKARTTAAISIDTTKSQVAARALEAGADIINDITALRGDPEMAALAAETGAGLVLMHMQGMPRTMQDNPTYGDVVAEVKEFLAQSAEKALKAGVGRDRIMLDPGIGFGKTPEHNLALIRRLPSLCGLGFPVLLAASRKGFIGRMTGKPPLERLWGTMGVHVLGAALGAHAVRVHDVEPLHDALVMSDAIMAMEE